jgi:ubiquitin-like 1-activating enzyme E1 A
MHGALPDNESAARELETIANSLISTADVNKQVLPQAPQDLIE